jgi:hypothetical protein
MKYSPFPENNYSETAQVVQDGKKAAHPAAAHPFYSG